MLEKISAAAGHAGGGSATVAPKFHDDPALRAQLEELTRLDNTAAAHKVLLAVLELAPRDCLEPPRLLCLLIRYVYFDEIELIVVCPS